MVSRALLNNWPLVPAAGVIPEVGPSAMRAGATNTSAFNRIDTSGAAQWSYLDRDAFYVQQDFDEIEVAIPLWTLEVISTVVREVALPEAYDFEMALEYPYNDSSTTAGNNVTQLLTLDGQVTYVYVPGDANMKAIFRAKLPFTVPANTAFGLIRLHECVAGRSGAVTNKRIVRAGGASTFMGRKCGQVAATTSLKGQTLTRKTFTSALSAQIGGTSSFLPGLIRTRHAAGRPSVLAAGNSIPEGANDGTSHSGTVSTDYGAGDNGGDARGNKGWATRYVDGRGVSISNISRGSDSDADRLVAGNFVMRSDLIAWGAFTHIIDMDGHNKIPASSLVRATNTAYAVDDVYRANGNGYIVTQAGTTDGGTGPTGTGADITDGTAKVTYIGPDDMGTGSQLGIAWAGRKRKYLRLVQAAAPSAKIVGVTTIPDVSAASTTTTTGKSGANVAVSAYTYDSGTGALVMTVGTTVASKLAVGGRVRIAGLSSLTTPGITNVNISAIDTTAGTVTVIRLPNQATPTGTCVLHTTWAHPDLQVPQLNFEAGSSYRSWINRFVRTNPNAVLPYSAVLDTAKHLEHGGGTTPQTETGVFKQYLEGGLSLGSAVVSDGIHTTSIGGRVAADGLLADPANANVFQ